MKNKEQKIQCTIILATMLNAVKDRAEKELTKMGDKSAKSTKKQGTQKLHKEFNLSDTAIVSDPDSASGVYLSVQSGLWFGTVMPERTGLLVWHTDYAEPASMSSSDWELNDVIGVDSGQAGVFCSTIEFAGRYGDLETFYGQCCAKTQSGHGWGVVMERGIVSISGMGDGRYGSYMQRNKEGKVIAILIDFRRSYR